MSKIFDRKYTPTPSEFNHHMAECIEYKKLVKLKDYLKWFNGKVAGVNITDLIKSIDNRIAEIPEESRIFTEISHGQTSK